MGRRGEYNGEMSMNCVASVITTATATWVLILLCKETNIVVLH